MADQYFEHQATTIRYRLEGDGPLVALVHGVGGTLNSWDLVSRELVPRFRILRYDLRGHGYSTKVRGRYELSHFVDEFIALLDHLNVESCHLVGFSLGGIVAQGIAIAYPQRLRKLVLSSTLAGVGPSDREYLKERHRKLERGIPGDHFRRSVDLYFSREFQRAHPERIAELEEQNKRNDPECYAAAYRIIAETDLAEELHKVESETLVMAGERERAGPAMAAVISDRIRDSRLVILDGLRHEVPIEAPEMMARAIEEFLMA